MNTTPLTSDDLPFWMRRALRGVDWGVLIVLLFCLLTAAPFISGGVPMGTAFERYIYRTAEYGDSLQSGRLYPRWSAEVLNGYGAPIPHYYAPLPGMLPALLDVTIFNDPRSSVAISMILALCVAGTSVYVFLARRCGAIVGMVGALAYIFNPFIGYTLPHQWGDLTLTLGAALLPALLWAVDPLFTRKRSGDVVLSAILFALLWLTDVRFAAAGVAFSIGLVILHAVGSGVTRPFRLVSGFVSGTLLAAAYWVPALLEADVVTWMAQPFYDALPVDWSRFFQPIVLRDPTLMIDIAQPTFGLALGVVSLLAVAILILDRTPTYRLQRLFGVATIILALVAVAGTPDMTWLAVPLALSLAIAASSAIAVRDRLPKPLYRVIPVGLCTILIGSALPLWSAAASDLNPSAIETDRAARFNFEQRGYGIAMLPPEQSIPQSITVRPQADADLIRSLTVGGFERIPQQSGAQIGVLSESAHVLRLQIETFAPTRLRLLTTSFPGWSARLGTETLLLERADDGMMALDLPSGAFGELVIALNPTSARWIGWVLTWGVVGLLVLGSLRRRTDGVMQLDTPLLSVAEARLFFVLWLGVAAALILPRIDTTFGSLFGFDSVSNRILREAIPVGARTDSAFEVTGYRGDVTLQLAPGDRLEAALLLRTLRPLSDNYLLEIALRDRVTGTETLVTPPHHPGRLPTSRWLPRGYAVDGLRWRVPDSLSAGNYELVARTFTCTLDCDSRAPLNFFQPDGTPLGEMLILPPAITIISA